MAEPERRLYHEDYTSDRVIENVNMCYPLPGTTTTTGATFATFAYRVYDLTGQYLGTLGEVNEALVGFGYGVNGVVGESGSGGEARKGRQVGARPVGTLIALEVSPTVGRAPIRVRSFGTSIGDASTLGVYTVTGRLVRRLVGQLVVGGREAQFTWDGRDGVGRKCPAGLYVCQVRGNDGARGHAKLVLIR